MTLTAQLYEQMAEGPSLLVSGELFAEGTWHVSVWLHQRQSGHWRMGRPTDSETWVLNHVMASKPARCGAHRVASKTERRELLRQIYQFVDEQTCTGRRADEHEQSLPPAANTSRGEKTMQCPVYTKRGKGPRCPNPVLEGQDVCKLHIYLIAKLGDLPRQAAVEPVAPLEGAPAEVPTSAEPIAVEPPRKTRNPRSDKGSHRRKRS
ncbi:MAG: hypothetical protein ACLP3R_06260 [Candidatus Korobacteraceae bacterium]